MKPILTGAVKQLIWVVLLTITIIRSSAAQETTKVRALEAPFSYDPILSPWPVIKVSINGAKPLPFALDTGSTVLTIEPWAVEMLHLKRQKNEYGAEEASIDTMRLDLIHSEPATLELTTMQVLKIDVGKTPQSEKIAGIIGIGFFDAIGVRLDFSRKILTIYPGDLPTFSKSAVIVPLLPSKTSGDNRVFVSAFIEGKEFTLLLDTGSPDSLLRQEDVLAESIRRRSNISMEARTVDATFHYKYAQLKQIRIAGVKVSDPIVRVLDEKGGSPALIGNNLLAGYAVTIDKRHMRMWLEPQTVNPQTQEPGGVSLLFETLPTGIFITDLFEPARSIGLHYNDRIVSIDGSPVYSDDTPAVVERRIYGRVGTTAVIEIERDHKFLTYRFRRLSFFDPITTLGVGFTPRSDISSGRIYVERVDEVTGKYLHVGDEIVKIGDLKVLGKKLEVLVPLFRQPKGSRIVLTIQREGEKSLRTVVLTVRAIVIPAK